MGKDEKFLFYKRTHKLKISSLFLDRFLMKNEVEDMKQLQIFLAFFRVGILGYGGGPSSIPLIHKEIVEKYKWMNSDEFSDILALGNALPGPIVTKMAGYIGYRVGGKIGMVNAIVASTIPTVVLMIIFLTVLKQYKNEPWVHGMSTAVIPVVAVMLLMLTLDFFKKSMKSSLGFGKTLLFIMGGLLFIEGMNIHPAIVIFALLILAIVKKESNHGKKEKEQL